jgi:hypothetical protein
MDPGTVASWVAIAAAGVGRDSRLALHLLQVVPSHPVPATVLDSRQRAAVDAALNRWPCETKEFGDLPGRQPLVVS